MLTIVFLAIQVLTTFYIWSKRIYKSCYNEFPFLNVTTVTELQIRQIQLMTPMPVFLYLAQFYWQSYCLSYQLIYVPEVSRKPDYSIILKQNLELST